MHRKGGYTRPYYQGGPKPFQQTHNPYNFNPEAGYPVNPYTIPKRPDVGYTGGGGGAGRVSLTAQYATSVAASHPPPNSAAQVQQQASQNQQIRAQAPPLPPSHNPHNTAGVPPPSVSHSQHLSHPHSALAQHQHHSVLSSGNVSGGVGLQNPVSQSAVSVQPGQSPAPPGSQHELSAQGISQVTSQQLQGSGVTLSGNVTASHSIMYPNGNPNQIPQNQQPNPQVRNLIGPQYFHSAQQTATPHMHPGNQQHRQVMTHAIPGGYPFANIAQPLLQSNQLYSQFTAATLAAQQHRPGTTNNQHFAPQMTQPQANHYHLPYAVQAAGFQPYVEGNGKAAWGGVKNHQYPPTVFYQQHKPVAAPAPPAQREKKIMAIIDPNTNKNILEEMSLAKANSSPSPMQSTESSTANTPALSEADAAQTKGALIASEFALQVLLSGEEGLVNEQSESIDCGLSTDKSIESSHCVISEINISVIDKTETVKIINQDNVPEPIVISKCEQPVIIQSQNSLPPQLPQSDIQIGIPPMPTNDAPQAQALTQQPPPQPQRPAKQPRGSQHQTIHAKNANQQQNSSKQSPPQHGNKNQTKSINPKGGNQAVQGQQQQSAKGRSSPNAQQNQKVSQNTQQPQQQQQNKQILHQAQQSKLSSENSHQASKVHQSNQASSHQQSHVQTLKEEVVPQHQGPVVPIQKTLSHGQGHRGSSPPQQATGAAQGMAGRRMSGEQAPPASAGPIKPDKRPSPPVEHVVEALKEPANKPNAAKSASVSPVTTAAPTKKEITPEPQIGQGKRTGKDKVPDDASQPKDVKEHPKTQVDEASPKGATAEALPTPQSKQPSQGKPPKSQQPTSNEKGVEVTMQMQSTSQSPKFDSLSQQSSATTQGPQISDVPSRVPQVEAPEAVASNGVDSITTSSSSGSSSSQPLKPEPVEVQANHVDEVPFNNHEENHVAEKPKSSSLKKYSYKEGQWSPENQDGKRQYDRDFLLEMQRNPLSLKRPDSLPNLEVVLDGPVNRPMDGKHKIVSDFTPAFLQNSNRRNQKFVGRSSQQGQKKGSDRGGDKDKSGEQKIVTISFDNRLKKSNNAWKPSTKKSETADDDETVRKMRGILNKLTPDNFRKLVDQVRNFNIRKFETFQQVIELIFEKAVDEQSFSTTYAELCKVLSQMSVRVEEREDETRFRNLIINKCQTEFEKDNSTFLKREEKEREIEAEKDKEKKTELKAVLDFEESRLRKRSVGNVRFIGELYKLKMLTSSIMMRIIGTLLNNKDEESLECLCKLLTTIGKLLESNAQQSVKAQVITSNVNQTQNQKQTPQDDLNEIFNRMKKLVESRKTSSRVRFLLMDVIDLRLNHWVPRREDAKPKTKAQVHEDIRKEEMEQQYLLSTAPRKDDRDRERKRSRDNRGGMQQPDEGWSIASNPRRGPFDSSRLRNNTFINRASGDNNVEFRAGFNCWARGSSGGMKDQEEEQQRPFNRFAVLDNQFPQQEMRRNNPVSGTFAPSFRPPRLAPGGGNAPHRQGTGSFGSKSMPPPSEKEHVNASAKMLSGSGDRSKSNSRSNSRQSSRESSLVRDHHPVGAPSHREVPQTFQKLDEASVTKFTKGIVEEYISSNDIKEAMLCVQEKFKGKNIVLFIQFSLEWVVDKNDDKRKKVGNLYHCLLKNKLITLNDLVEGTKEIIEMIPDFEIDIPQVSEYVGVIFSRLVVDNVVTLQDILKLIEPAGSRYPTIFATVLKESSSVLGEIRVRDMFKASELDLDKLVPAGTTVQDYLTKHDISFLLIESIMYNNRPISDEEAPIDAKFVRGELTHLFKKQADEEEIFKWIEANIGRFTNTKKFVRALTAALLVSLLASSDGSSFVTVPGFEEKLKERAKFIYKYVDNNQHLELACLYSIQGLSVEYQHPSGFVEKAFNSLYDRDTISDETFFKWEKSDDPEEQVGKGVCVTSVNKFLKWLKEAEQEAEPEHAELGVEGN